MPTTVYILDGAYYIYRAYYALGHLTNAEGFPTNALFGFVGMLNKLIASEQPTHLVVTFDPSGPTFRNEIYPEYKANRDETPEDLVPQLPLFRQIVRGYGIPIFELEGVEADDVIGTLARHIESQGHSAVLVSGDKDLTQLLSERVTMLDTMRERRTGPDEVVERYGARPEQMPDVLGLMGDSSDNIPGVPGVGQKTAAKLIGLFSSLEGVYEHIDEAPGKKLKERLVEHKEGAFLSRRLATIRTDLPLEFDLAAAELGRPDLKALTTIFQELDFQRYLAELNEIYGKLPSPESIQPPPEVSYRSIHTVDDLDRVIAAIRRAGRMAIDTETTSLEPMKAHLVGLSLAWAPGRAVYIPVGHVDLLSPDQLMADFVVGRLRPLLEDPAVEKVGQNIKYDWIVLAQHGVQLAGVVFDPMLASYILDPSRDQHGLDVLAKDYLGVETIKYSEVAGKGKKRKRFDDVLVERAVDYAAEDADMALRLTVALSELLDTQGLRPLHDQLELPLSLVLAGMERRGVLVDRDTLRRLSHELERGILSVEEQIHEVAGRRFNVASPKQLAEVLFDHLGLPVVKETKSGPSTDRTVLEQLAPDHPIAALVLEHRQQSKLKNTYTDVLPALIHPETGRIHTDYKQTVAATGRLSSNNPNLQNIPVRTEEGRKIRSAFVAPRGMLLLGADYSQVELRILAHMSQDAVLIDAFRQGQDIHARTAAEIFEVTPEEVTRAHRAIAKTINFGVLYGMGANRLARELDISRKEAKAFIKRYFERIQGVNRFLDELVQQATKLGYAETMLGRRRPLKELYSRSRAQRALGERLAVNTPIQGTAADIIKRAMVNIQRRLDASDIDAHMLMQVHDELVFEVDKDQVEALKALVVAEMEGAVELSVPLSVDVGAGANWAELK
jgi:DNA polymerase-1